MGLDGGAGGAEPGGAPDRGPALVQALPPELAFLPAGLMAPGLLRETVATAAQLGVSAERVALAEGLVSADTYYRRLAAHLGLPFAERPLRPAAGATIDAVLEQGFLPLAPNRHGWTALAAPRGALLRRLLDEGWVQRRAGLLALTTPDRLEALVRQDRGRDVARAASHGLAEWNDALSARAGLSKRQVLCLALGCAAAATLLPWCPSACLDAAALLFSAAFLLAVTVRLAATSASPPPRGGLPPRRIPDRDLPVYSVVVPLFREAREVRRLTAALSRLDYPRSKLDILLIVEANDPATVAALEALRLPSCFRIVMAPAGYPQTKPRALNVALQFARGDVLVVYDAEDEPEPGQLRAALAGFAAAPDLACLQARLAIDNDGDSWLTRLFAIEYAALFDVVNPGLV